MSGIEIAVFGIIIVVAIAIVLGIEALSQVKWT